MNLLYITNGINGTGGLERVLSIKASVLADEFNYNVLILSLNEPVAKPFFPFSDKVKFTSIAVGGNPLAYFSSYSKGINKVVSEFKPDVISVCDDGLKGFLLPRLITHKCPIIYERHVSKLISLSGVKGNKLREWSAKIQFKLMDMLGARFDRFVLLTEGNANEWPLSNLEIIANPTSFYPETVSTLDQKRVIAVGKHSDQKGFDRLLEAWKLLSNDFPDWKLEIYGTINPAFGHIQHAKELGIDHQVSFYPPEKNIEQKYLSSSLYVMSSRFEGFGMVLIEAMACGVPCVTFDCPYGPSDIVQHKVDGLVVPNNDIKALANGLRELMQDDVLRKAYGAKARVNVLRYSALEIAGQWDRLFKSLATKN